MSCKLSICKRAATKMPLPKSKRAPFPPDFSSQSATVGPMVSHTRSVSSRSRRRPQPVAPAAIAATHPIARPSRRTTDRTAPTDLRKRQNKRKHLVLKWVLGIFAALLAAGIGLFAYMYITTEIPEPEKFALAEKQPSTMPTALRKSAVTRNKTARSSTARYCLITWATRSSHRKTDPSTPTRASTCMASRERCIRT